jgi:hypothetical protein
MDKSLCYHNRAVVEMGMPTGQEYALWSTIRRPGKGDPQTASCGAARFRTEWFGVGQMTAMPGVAHCSIQLAYGVLELAMPTVGSPTL